MSNQEQMELRPAEQPDYRYYSTSRLREIELQAIRRMLAIRSLIDAGVPVSPVYAPVLDEVDAVQTELAARQEALLEKDGR